MCNLNHDLECQHAAEAERERIIKLLEQHLCTFEDTEIVECWCGSFNEAITLIKRGN